MKRKPNFDLVYSDSRTQITRDRAAYLLRAGRSRKRGNVYFVCRGLYLIEDIGAKISQFECTF